MEEIKITVGVKLDLENDFKEHLREKKVSTTYNTGYNYRNPNCFDGVRFSRGLYPPSDDRSIFFYEFSDTGRLPRKFEKVSEFLRWAKTYDLYFSDYTKEQLETHPMNYVSCYKNTHTVVVRHTWTELKTAIDNFAKYNPYDPRTYADDEYGRYNDYWD